MWGIIAEIAKGLLSAVVEGFTASKERVDQLGEHCENLLLAGAAEVRAARLAFKAEDDETEQVIREAKRLRLEADAKARIAAAAVLPPPPVSSDPTPGVSG